MVTGTLGNPADTRQDSGGVGEEGAEFSGTDLVFTALS